MNLKKLLEFVVKKEKFTSIDDYMIFCSHYLDFIKNGLQARIVSQNESNYNFFQYKKEGNYNITRPINQNLMYDEKDEFDSVCDKFLNIFNMLRDGEKPDESLRIVILRIIYTIGQSIGTVLDALPSGKSNQARKINGDLFESLICKLISHLNVYHFTLAQ